MKVHFLSLSLFSLTSAFTTTDRYLWSPSSSSCSLIVNSKTVLSAEGSESVSASKKRPLSPKEILAQQRARQGLPDPDEHPKLYSDELLDDMKEILLVLEKRVQGGQGSISAVEVEKFVKMSNNVLVEMKHKEYERLEDATSSSPGLSPATTSSVSTSGAAAKDNSESTPTANVVIEKPPADTSDTEYNETEEGPAYDPAGGQGSLAKGTTNTYIIPGMEEMSVEEYRLALQQSLIDRQDRRKATGKYGNRNTWDYLNNLGGEKGILKDDEFEN